MTQDDLVKILTSGGGFGAIVFVCYLIGTRMIKSNDKATDRIVAVLEKVNEKIDAHRAADVQSHGEMHVAIVAIHGRIDGLLEGQDRYTPVSGVPETSTGYHLTAANKRRP